MNAGAAGRGLRAGSDEQILATPPGRLPEPARGIMTGARELGGVVGRQPAKQTHPIGVACHDRLGQRSPDRPIDHASIVIEPDHMRRGDRAIRIMEHLSHDHALAGVGWVFVDPGRRQPLT